MEKSVHVTTSIPMSLWNLAKEKHFNWNECLILGIRTMNGERLAPIYREEQKEIERKLINANSFLQGKIQELNDELSKLHGSKKKRGKN